MEIEEITEKSLWIQEFRQKFRVAHTFVFHGAIDDYIAHSEGGTPIRAKDFLIDYLCQRREIVLTYNLSSGLHFAQPQMKKKFLEYTNDKTTYDNGPFLLDPRHMCEQMEKVLLAPQAKNKVAICFEDAELLWPNAEYTHLNEKERFLLSTIRRWAKGIEFIKMGQIISLWTVSIGDLQDSLKQTSSLIEPIFLPYPNVEERKAFIEEKLSYRDDLYLAEGLSSTQFAALTGGLTRALINDICLRAIAEDKRIDAQMIKSRKDQIIKNEFGDLIEVLEPSVGFSAVGGMQEIKQYMEASVVKPLHDTRLRGRMPNGIMLAGPPGTGKCVVGETLIACNKGLIPIKDICNNYTDKEAEKIDVQVSTWTKNKKETASFFYQLGKQSTLRLKLANGITFEGTPEHPVLDYTQKFVELQNLQSGDEIHVLYGNKMFGQKSISKIDISNMFKSSNIDDHFVNNLLQSDQQTHEYFIDQLQHCPLQFNPEILSKIICLLINFGFEATIENGKIKQLNKVEGLKSVQIKSITPSENYVYDLTVPEGNNFWSNGIISHNTFLVTALAKEAGVSVVKLNAGKLLGQYVGNSERNLEKALACIRSLAPTIVMIDEIEQQFQRGGAETSGVERRIFGRILEEMSGASGTKRGDVIWIAATNRVDMVDAALRRPGRFDRIVPILPPGEEERWEIIKTKIPGLDNVQSELKDILLSKTKNYTGADIDGLLIKTAEIAFDSGAEVSNIHHIIQALEVLRPSDNAQSEQMIEIALAHCNDLSLIPKDWHDHPIITGGNKNN